MDVWIDIDAEMQIFVLLCNLFILKRKKISQSLEGSVRLEITMCLFLIYGLISLVLCCYFQFEEISRLFLLFRVEG